jgi:hypothetical protein
VKARRFRASDINSRGDGWEQVEHALYLLRFDCDERPYKRQSRTARCKAKPDHECARLGVRRQFAGTRKVICTLPDTPCSLRMTATEQSIAFPEPVDHLPPFTGRDSRAFLAFVRDAVIAYSKGDDELATTAFATVYDQWPAVDALASPAFRNRHGAKWRSEWRQACMERACRQIARDYDAAKAARRNR